MLKEFDLDAPKEPKLVRQKFRLETRCVTALFERCFASRQKTGKAWKLLIEAVPTIKRREVRDLLGVLTVERTFDVAGFFELPSKEKKAEALSLLNDGAEVICREKGWDFEPFRLATDAVRKLDYVNEWVWGRPFKHPDSLASVEILCRHDVDAFTVAFRMRRNRTALPKIVPVATASPTEFIFTNLLGRAKWEGDCFKLFSKNGDLVGEMLVNADCASA